MPTLIFDIETVGEDFDALDETTQESLTQWIRKSADDEEEYERELADLKAGLGFSPLTGEIVAIGVLDYAKSEGAVYFQAPSADLKDTEEGGIKFRPMSEKEMLEQFWKLAKTYDEFITFNGRSFDVPFLLIRSAIHHIKPTKDLMSNRYVTSQRSGALHIDLFDQLTFYGAMRRKGNLHLWTRAFGIKSPKGEGIKGEDVSRFFRAGRFLEIARYNAGDLWATKELYAYWQNYLRL
jgi:hypothetical protein